MTTEILKPDQRHPAFVPTVATTAIYNRLKRAEYGEIVALAELSQLAQTSIDGLRGYLDSARKKACDEDGVVFDSVRGVGLKRLTEEEKAAKQQRRRAHIARQAKSGLKELRTVDYARLSSTAKVRHNVETAILATHVAVEAPKNVGRIETASQNNLDALTVAETMRLFRSE